MHYREFGEIDWRPSALGFGAMRLPTKNDERDNIDKEKAIKMIRYSIDNGVNYIDTAWPYHGGNSEKIVGKALEDGYREKTRIATKLPSWEIENPEDPDHYLDKQLEKLGTDHINFYLLHALNQEYWNNYMNLEMDIFDWLENKKEEGKIGHIGFSFHDDLNLFKEIIDSYDWDFCQIQYNYLDQEFQAGKEGLKYASAKDIGVIVMEPLRGGKLAQEPPKPIKNIWKSTNESQNAVEWALKWLWNQPEVSLVLSGMTTMEQVKENIEIADQSGINDLNDEELEAVNRAKEKYQEISPVNCTGCNYCVPCPNGVSIPRNFRLYNRAKIYDEFSSCKEIYENMDDDSKASACIRCGECEKVCPQNLEIMDQLEKVASYFEE